MGGGAPRGVEGGSPGRQLRDQVFAAEGRLRVGEFYVSYLSFTPNLIISFMSLRGSICVLAFV